MHWRHCQETQRHRMDFSSRLSLRPTTLFPRRIYSLPNRSTFSTASNPKASPQHNHDQRTLFADGIGHEGLSEQKTFLPSAHAKGFRRINTLRVGFWPEPWLLDYVLHCNAVLLWEESPSSQGRSLLHIPGNWRHDKWGAHLISLQQDVYPLSQQSSSRELSKLEGKLESEIVQTFLSSINKFLGKTSYESDL